MALKSLRRISAALKKQPRNLKIAIAECAIICLLAFAAPLVYIIPQLVELINYNTSAAQVSLSSLFFGFLGLILPFLLIILIGTVLYFNLRTVFNYPIESLFHGIIFSIFGMYAFLLYTGIIALANPLVVRPDNAHIYWLPIIFFFPIVHNSILLFREAYTHQKSDNFKYKLNITILIAIMLLVIGTFVSLLEDEAFVREYNLTLILLLPASAVIAVMYKLLFRKPVTTRSVAYFPLALFLTYLISFNIAPGFPDMLTRSFSMTEYASYMAIGCLVAFILMLIIRVFNIFNSWALSKFDESNDSKKNNRQELP